MKKIKLLIVTSIILIVLALSSTLLYINKTNNTDLWQTIQTTITTKRLYSEIDEDLYNKWKHAYSYLNDKERCEKVQVDYLYDLYGVIIKAGYNTTEVESPEWGDIVAYVFEDGGAHVAVYLDKGYVLSGNTDGETKIIKLDTTGAEVRFYRWNGEDNINVSCNLSWYANFGYESYPGTEGCTDYEKANIIPGGIYELVDGKWTNKLYLIEGD